MRRMVKQFLLSKLGTRMGTGMARARLLRLLFLPAIFLVVVFAYTARRSSSLSTRPASSISSDDGHDTPPSTLTPLTIAAIIEPRPLPNLIPVLLHFSTVLGPTWPIVLYTTPSTISTLNSSALTRLISTSRLSIRPLPNTTSFSNHAAVSEFLTAAWFWDQLAPAKHVLLFQADSILCSSAPRSVDDYLEYDFIGAPIDRPIPPPSRGGREQKAWLRRPGHGEGFNGGLSLRNRETVLEIITRWDWSAERAQRLIPQRPCVTREPCLKFEDQWFYSKMRILQTEVGGDRIKLPSREVAAGFAVETVWSERPLGYHQVERWNKKRLGEVREWCPEYALATGRTLVGHWR